MCSTVKYRPFWKGIRVTNILNMEKVDGVSTATCFSFSSNIGFRENKMGILAYGRQRFEHGLCREFTRHQYKVYKGIKIATKSSVKMIKLCNRAVLLLFAKNFNTNQKGGRNNLESNISHPKKIVGSYRDRGRSDDARKTGY